MNFVVNVVVSDVSMTAIVSWLVSDIDVTGVALAAAIVGGVVIAVCDASSCNQSWEST